MRMPSGRFIVIAVTAIVIAGLANAQDESVLKQRIQTRSEKIVELLKSGAAVEGSDGMLRSRGQLDPQQKQLVDDENKDRQAVFAMIAEKTKVSADEVASMYYERAKVKFPPEMASKTGIGSCNLTPARNADVARLLQYLKQGMNYASQKKYDLALAEFQQARTIDKNFLGLNGNAGAAQLGLKKYADAEASLNAELKLTECLASLNDSQLANFAYFMEVDEKDAGNKREAQAARLKSQLPKAKAEANYNLACAYSLQRQKEPALKALQAAIDAGYSNTRSLNSDPDLGFIRQAPEFRDIVARTR